MLRGQAAKKSDWWAAGVGCANRCEWAGEGYDVGPATPGRAGAAQPLPGARRSRPLAASSTFVSRL
eukprot:4842444-Prymnesium_polylepis.1